MRYARMFAISGVVSVLMTAIGLALAEAEAAPLSDRSCAYVFACAQPESAR
ncbi:hypothetical protein ACWDYH_06725 [Nocardia goodfellowii]|uniref:Uncharacterized protein n=1 Tax=Nocardia goodfellowii TaxID=882446 RepID=A0ABS4QLE1_9NOCA|nr:hypothetical protein [Nocardia goodfellowii]MBP2191844.1 hypothetical protein [Nocardia goodfellowii]